MTTPPQPTTQSGRGRKRPAPGSPAPPVSSLPATAAPATEMNYFNGLPETSSAPGPAGNMYASDPATPIQTSQADIFRHQGTTAPQGNIYPPHDANNQLTRVPRPSQLMRVPSFGGMNAPGIPQQIVPSAQMQMNMNMMGPNMVGQPGGFEHQVDGTDALDRELFGRIEKMKKKRANIPPFVLKLSRFVNDPKTDNLIRWSPIGNSFMVLDEDEFSKRLIPDLFKHNNYASFVRQLNMYGFHKVVGLADGSLKTSEQRSKPPSEYENPYFKKGQPDLMWLIQKPKSKNARAKGKKGVKQEEQDTDREDNVSDAGGGDGDIGGSYLEGPKDANSGHHSGGRNRGVDFSALSQQIEAVRNHQALISQAINRLRKDHQQLYEQSLAFQSLHDRHENSINAILTFLATVYDKSLGGHINGAVNNLFSHQVDQGQALHRGAPGTTGGAAPNGAIIPTAPNVRQGVIRTPQMNRRKPLLLEGGPTFSGDLRDVSSLNDSLKANGSPVQHNYQQYQPGQSAQELFPAVGGNGNVTSPADSPQQHDRLGATPPTSTGLFSPTLSLPNSPIPTSTPHSNHTNTHYSTAPPLPHPTATNHNPIPTPRTIAKTLGTPFLGATAQALHDHNVSLAQKSREMEELEVLQSRQNENIDQLMGMMRDYSDPEVAPSINADMSHGDVDQFFDFGLQGDGFAGDGYTGDSHMDIEELLRDVGVDGSLQNGQKGQVLGTNPSTVVASPATSSVGSRAREELEEEIEEVQAKRRRVS